MAPEPLSHLERAVVDALRGLDRQSNEWRLEVIGSRAHGKRAWTLRPTPYYRIEESPPPHQAVDD